MIHACRFARATRRAKHRLGRIYLLENYKASRIERAAFSEVQSGVRLSRALFSGTRRSRVKSARAAPNEACFLVAAREKTTAHAHARTCRPRPRRGRGTREIARNLRPRGEKTRSENGNLPVAPAGLSNLSSPLPPRLIHLEGPSVDDSRISRCSRYHRYARISDFQAPRNATRSRSCLLPSLSLSLSLPFPLSRKRSSLRPYGIPYRTPVTINFSPSLSQSASPGLRFFYKGHSDTGQEALTILFFFFCLSPPSARRRGRVGFRNPSIRFHVSFAPNDARFRNAGFRLDK